jgi:hypothetical protein
MAHDGGGILARNWQWRLVAGTQAMMVMGIQLISGSCGDWIRAHGRRLVPGVRAVAATAAGYGRLRPSQASSSMVRRVLMGKHSNPNISSLPWL